MVRKTLYVSVAVCLLLVGIMPVSVAMAQGPQPPQPDQGTLKAPPQIDFTSLPETVQKAAQLQKSLSPSQQAAVRQALDRYSSEMKAISSVDMAANPAVAAPAAKQPEVKQADKDLVARMTALVNAIDAEMATILNADQLALYRAVTQPDLAATQLDLARPTADNLPKVAGPDRATKPDSASSPQSYTSNCYYSAIYTSIAKYYAYYGYLYAYYNYYYYGTTYGYYAYYYAYYDWINHLSAIDYSSRLYFTWYYAGMYTSGDPYYAYYYAYYAYLYAYYAYIYASADYSNTGHSYAYYAYYYEYYKYVYMSSGESYAYYCYYYS